MCVNNDPSNVRTRVELEDRPPEAEGVRHQADLLDDGVVLVRVQTNVLEIYLCSNV